jgi:hypothetical protein
MVPLVDVMLIDTQSIYPDNSNGICMAYVLQRLPEIVPNFDNSPVESDVLRRALSSPHIGQSFIMDSVKEAGVEHLTDNRIFPDAR